MTFKSLSEIWDKIERANLTVRDCLDSANAVYEEYKIYKRKNGVTSESETYMRIYLDWMESADFYAHERDTFRWVIGSFDDEYDIYDKVEFK